MSSARRAPVGLVALVALVASRAAAGEAALPESLHLLPVGCGSALPELRELPRRLALELSPVRIVDGEGAAELIVVTSCEGVIALLMQWGRGTPSGRDVELADVAPELRPAALGVLAAEFVRSSLRGEESPATPEILAQAGDPVGVARFESEAPPPAPTVAAPAPPRPTSPPPVVPRRDSVAANAPPEPPGPQLSAAAVVHWFPSPGSLLYGGGLAWREPWLFLGAGAALGRHTDSLGELSLGLAAASAGLRFELVQTPELSLALLGAVDVGWSWASANAGDAGVKAGADSTLLAAATAGAELGVPIDGAVSALISLRGGVARGLSVTADGREITGMQGPMVSGALGLAYALGR